jgi:hypothetical protein
LDDVQNYSLQWGIKINTNKTKVIIFEKGRHTNLRFKIANTELETVKSFKYLGVHLFKNGHWNRTQKTIAHHASFAMHNLFTVFNQLELQTSEKIKLFDSLVGSILNYGGEVWGTYEAKDVESIHCKFLRKILCVKKSTNLEGLYGELGRTPMIVQRHILMIKYWVKILRSSDTLTRKIYNMLKIDTEHNLTYNNMNWASQVKHILDQIGLGYIWINQDDHDINFEQIKQRIKDIYYQSWYANINNSRRLASYSIFKHEFKFENYLDNIKTNKFRIALSKFRLSSHDLAIETGRYTNTPRDERKCRHCNITENEYHFLLVCPKFRHLRQKYFKPYFCHWPNMHKFESLMSTNSPKIIENISKYIYFAFKLRTAEE